MENVKNMEKSRKKKIGQVREKSGKSQGNSFLANLNYFDFEIFWENMSPSPL